MKKEHFKHPYTKWSILCFLLPLFVFSGCRKGENDPLLSLLSRKARLTGSWNVNSFEKKRVIVEDSETTTFEEYFNGLAYTTTKIVQKEGISMVEENKDKMEISQFVININRDGTWTSNFVKTTTTTITLPENILIIEERETRDTEGIWAFLDKSKDYYKNKERLQLDVLNLSVKTTINDGDTETKVETFLPGDSTQVYAIDRLTNKEMVLEIDEAYVANLTNVDGETGASGTYSGGASSFSANWVLTK
jgi:hypothetical protein